MIIAMQKVHDKYRAICQHLTLDRLSIVVDKTSASGAEIWDLIFSKLINFNLDQKQDVMKPQNFRLPWRNKQCSIEDTKF